MQARERAQRRAVVLRPRPAKHVDGSIRIETRLAEQYIPCKRTYLRIGAEKLTEPVPHRLPVAALPGKFSAVEFAQRQAEFDEVVEVAAPARALVVRPGVVHQIGGAAHDDCRITQPVEEIVGLGIPIGDNRRGEHRTFRRHDCLTERLAPPC